MDNIWWLKREAGILMLILGLLLSGPATGRGAEAKAIEGLESQPAKIKEAILKDQIQTTSGMAKPGVNPPQEILPQPQKEIPTGRRCCVRR